MGLPPVGTVVLVDFPYSNYINFKKRPALVIGLADLENLIICQITTKTKPSRSAVDLAFDDFQSGGLESESFIRADKIYTIEASIVEKILGEISNQKMSGVKQKIARLFASTKTP